MPILSFPVAGEVRFGKLIFAIGMYERQLKTLTPEFERDSRQYAQATGPSTVGHFCDKQASRRLMLTQRV